MKLSYVLESLKEKAKKLLEVLDEAGTPIVVTAHRNADPDALASAIAMREAICKLGYDARLLLPEGMSQPSKRLVREVLGVEPEEVEDDSPEESAAAIVVDTASLEQLGKLAEFIQNIDLLVVVDHHESNKLVEKACVAIHWPWAKATSEIVYMLVEKALEIELDKTTRTLLLAGIIYDTRHFVMATSTTLRVAADLMDAGADKDKALKALQSPSMEMPERIARLKAAQRMHIFRADNYIVTITRVGAYEASVARALLDLGADIAIVLAERGTETRVIGRLKRNIAEKLGISLGTIMEELARQLGGGGGGHQQAAGATVKADYEKTLEEIIQALKKLFREKGLQLEPLA
ncbi:MAG TPA: DHH family phosphoesterase [Pyrodictiaceae archaeon]|nr:DHH family phosphoesterase [Pyrodictiaceae archaeon]HIQ10462.1 DHH family phosphoesterase [Pyrodictium sp.]HIQ56186.1 DHH family phosphoesterase [Pyrodictium sp.]